VRHKCKRKLCCIIEHLELGTPKQNSEDRVRDGTDNRGSKNPNASLTEDAVKEIKENKDGLTKNQLAQKHNVRVNVIRKIQRGERWTHVETDI
jgi:ribosome-binding protein aMBF1 (putative translation factor)